MWAIYLAQLMHALKTDKNAMLGGLCGAEGKIMKLGLEGFHEIRTYD